METLPKFFIRLQKQKKWTGLHDALWIAWRCNWELFTLHSVVDSWFGQGTHWMYDNFSQLFLPFAIINYDSHNLENCFKCVSAIVPQLFLSSHVIWWLRQKSIGRVFRIFFGKTRLFGKIFFSGFVVLYTQRQLLELRCSETNFAKQRLPSFVFGMIQFSFSAELYLRLG